MNFLRGLAGLLLIALFLANSLLAQGYRIQDLGEGIALDINSSGKIVGTSGGFGFHFDGTNRSLVTQLVLPNVVDPTAPPSVISATSSSIVALNDTGDMVGMIATGTGINTAILISGTNRVILGSQMMTSTVVTGINDSGLISGWQVMPPYGHNIGIQVAGSLGVPNFSRLHAVNAQGIFAGSWGTESPTFRDFRAYRCRAMVVSPTGTITVIDTRTLNEDYLSFAENSSDDNHWSDAYGINGSGTVVGAMRSVDGSTRHAFKGTAGSMQDLGTLGGFRSTAYDIDSSGQVVGEAETTGGTLHAFRYADGVMTDLNNLLMQPADSGWELLTAKAINDRGEIVGQGRFHGELHAFLLSPAGLAPAPWIVTQPHGGRFAVGQSLTLSVQAGGTAPLSFQWIRNGTNLANATNATWIIPSATGRDGGDYSVRVINSGGSVLSQAAHVEVLDPELAVETFVALRITGEVGASYEVQSRPSANLSVWTPLTRITLVSTHQSWIDPDSNRNPGRLYRAVRLP